MSDSNKKIDRRLQLASQVAAKPIARSILSCSLVRPPPVARRILPPEIYSMIFSFTQGLASRTLKDEEGIGFLVLFVWRRTSARDLLARIAIALELLELLPRVQQGDRGARSAADGEWRVAMSADSFRVFRWPERSRWRAQWGSEWPERPPVLRPRTAPALPIA